MKNSNQRYLQIILGPVFATAFGLVAVLLLGLVSWSLARGVTGIFIGTVVSAMAAALLRWQARWPISIIASGLGAVVACYFAIATAELLPPGSFEWMWKGGLYGAMFGIPVAAVLSPLGLLGVRRVSTK